MSMTKAAAIPAITGEVDKSVAVYVFPSALTPYRAAIITYATLALSIAIGFPFDTVKTRMQTYSSFTSVFDCIVKSYNAGGWSGFYRGIWAPMVSTAFLRSFNVLVFTSVKPYFYKMMVGSKTMGMAATHPFVVNVPVCFAAGAASGLATSIIACPFEFSKVFSQIEVIARRKATELPTSTGSATQLGSSPPLKRYTTTQTVIVIVRNLGLSGLYTGYKFHVLRDAIGSATYYAVYESCKWASNTAINGDPRISSPVSILVAGGLSGASSWAVIFPFDTSKALVQRDMVTNLIRKENGQKPLPSKKRKLEISRRMYHGLGVSIYRSIVVSMVFFGTYEFAMKHFF